MPRGAFSTEVQRREHAHGCDHGVYFSVASTFSFIEAQTSTCRHTRFQEKKETRRRKKEKRPRVQVQSAFQ